MSNHYKNKAKKKSLLGELSPEEKEQRKKDMKEAFTETAKQTPTDIGAAIGGGFVGSAIGRPSLMAGALVSAVSHFFKRHIGDTVSRIGSVFGVGIMAGGFSKASGTAVSGTDTNTKSHTEAAKERMHSYWQDLKERIYADKFTGAKKTEQEKKTTTKEEEGKTVGETEQTFIYPDTKPQKKEKEMDLSALDEFENGLHKTASDYKQKSESTDGLGESGGLDPEEKNY